MGVGKRLLNTKLLVLEPLYYCPCVPSPFTHLQWYRFIFAFAYCQRQSENLLPCVDNRRCFQGQLEQQMNVRCWAAIPKSRGIRFDSTGRLTIFCGPSLLYYVFTKRLSSKSNVSNVPSNDVISFIVTRYVYAIRIYHLWILVPV